MFLGEQPVGPWVDEIVSWTTQVKREATCKHIIDQCSTGLRASYGTLIKKPTEMMADHHAILKPFGNRRCVGNHERARACSRGLVQAAQCTPKTQSLIVD
eukprot:1861758-Pyramimonas_sp.AAC.1